MLWGPTLGQLDRKGSRFVIALVENPIIDICNLPRFRRPGEMVVCIGLCGACHRCQIFRAGCDIFQLRPKRRNNIRPRSDWNFVPGAGDDQFARPGVIDDHGYDPHRHCFQNDASAEFGAALVHPR